MLFRSTLAVAGLAALSSAFLVPSTFSSVSKTDAVTSLPFEVASAADAALISLDCQGCPVPVGKTAEGLSIWMQGPAFKSQLDFDFQIHHLKDNDVLTVNGLQVFPLSSSFSTEPLTATQILIESDEERRIPVTLGYNTELQLVRAPTEQENLALYKIRLQIIEIGNKFVDGLDVIEMDVIATPTGGLMIVDFAKSPSINPAVPTGNACQSMICRLRAALAASSGRIQEMKPKMRGHGCHGKGKGRGKFAGILGHFKPAGKEHGGHRKENMESHDHKAHKSHHGHHGHQHRHHRFGSFFHTLKSVGLQVLIPVFVGIAAGITASFVGMIAGHLIVFFWRAFYRGGAKSATYHSKARTEEKAVEEDEKHFILVEDVEDAPAYKDETYISEKLIAQ